MTQLFIRLYLNPDISEYTTIVDIRLSYSSLTRQINSEFPTLEAIRDSPPTTELWQSAMAMGSSALYRNDTSG